MGIALVLVGCGAAATVLGLFGYQGMALFGLVVLCGLTVERSCTAVENRAEPFQYVQGADIFLV